METAAATTKTGPWSDLFARLKNPADHLRAPIYFYWVDILRALAAISVLIWHYQHFYFPAAGINPVAADRSIQPFYIALSFFYKHGGSAVQLFWVISGFILAATYVKPSPVSTITFAANRFARLYPLHLLTLLSVAALQAISFHATGGFQIYKNNDIYHFLLNVLMISNWGFESGPSFNWPIWSVSVELLIYAVFFIGVRFATKKCLRLFAACLGGFLLLAIFRIHGGIWSCGLYFFSGCLVFVFWNALSEFPLTLLAAGAAGVVAAMALGQISPPFIGSEQQLLLLFPSIVLIAGVLDLLIKENIGSKFRLAGNLTYGIYLWHIPVQIGLILALGYLGIDRAIISSGWFFLFFMALVPTVAFISFKYYERPAKEIIRRRFAG